MSQLEELKKIREKINSNMCTISDLKNVYQKVNTETEMILAQKEDIKHLYYRDTENRTVILEENLLPYEKRIDTVKYSTKYPLDLCIPIFYDEEINRYGQGIIIPRRKEFVMVDDMNLIKRPDTESFYTKGVRENNENCASIVDLQGNLYRMFGYDENDGNFKFSQLEQFILPSCLYDFYGILVHYNGRPIYADIMEPPYIILNKETLQKCGDKIRYIDSYVEMFDDEFMQGKRYVKK
ncbi:MAG: hypothetical protein HFJ12_04150 [Bacilli bacterium]|nr:hypothetical protein [Bacilli bacterium]